MGKHKTSFEARVDWLVIHIEVWNGWPGDEHMDRRILAAMQQAGLVSIKTHYREFNIGRLIAEAKVRIRHKHSDRLRQAEHQQRFLKS